MSSWCKLQRCFSSKYGQPAFLREIFFFFPKKGSSHSDRSDCSRSSAHRCFKAPAMPQTMHATLFVFTSTLRNTEPISAAMKGKKKKKFWRSKYTLSLGREQYTHICVLQTRITSSPLHFTTRRWVQPSCNVLSGCRLLSHLTLLEVIFFCMHSRLNSQ